MTPTRFAAIIPGMACVFIGLFSLANHPAQTRQPDNRGDVERGRYLVEEVARCTECHTPRTANGDLDQHAWLQGAPIWIMPVHHIKDWADHAPAIAGLPGLTEEEAERVLEKGIGPEGETLRPPMHIYHMSHADAKAIVAYLNSLPRSVH